MAKKISPSSQSVASSALHLNHIPGTQTQIVSTRFQEVSPLTDLNQRSLRFEVPQDIRVFLDLGETSVYVQCAIRDKNNDKISADKPVGVVNYLLGSLFKRVTYVPSSVIKKTRGYMDIRTYGHTFIRTYGYMDIRTYMHTDI
jgi:hypothetical protein